MKKVVLSFFPLLTSLIFIGSAAAHVVLDFPVGGETFVVGDTVNIQWHIVVQHNIENWDLYFSPDGGANWEIIALDIQSPQLNYQWTVPQETTEQARIRICMDNTSGNYDDVSGNFSIREPLTSIQGKGDNPQVFELYPNYPNPFNPSTFISYKLSTVSDVQLTIYNPSGQRIVTLVNERQTAGIHRIQWDGRDSNDKPASSGVYFYRLKAGSFIQTRKMALLR